MLSYCSQVVRPVERGGLADMLCSRLRLFIVCLVEGSQRDVMHEFPTLGVIVADRYEGSPVPFTVL